jgi:hypothetical protein
MFAYLFSLISKESSHVSVITEDLATLLSIASRPEDGRMNSMDVVSSPYVNISSWDDLG